MRAVHEKSGPVSQAACLIHSHTSSHATKRCRSLATPLIATWAGWLLVRTAVLIHRRLGPTWTIATSLDWWHKAWTTLRLRTAITATHAILWCVHGLPFEMLRAFMVMLMLTPTRATEMVPLRSASLIKLRRRTTRTIESAILPLTAELLRLLAAFGTLFRPASHHAWATTLHFTIK